MGLPNNGMLMMLKSLGLGDAIEGVQKLIEAGTLEKIIVFADGLGELNERIGKIESAISELRRLLAPSGNPTH